MNDLTISKNLSFGRTLTSIAAAAEDLARAKASAADCIERIHASMAGHPPSRALDAVGRGATIVFCERHERDHCPCGSSTTYPALSDPTGEAAMRRDRAATDHDRVRSLVASLRKQADELVRVLDRYAARAPSSKDMRSTLADNDRSWSANACRSCARTTTAAGAPWYEPVFRGDVCRWCHDQRSARGVLPSVADVQRYHDGVRVRRRV